MTIHVTVFPAVATPRQVVTATVTATPPVGDVTAASLEWGYTNSYRYQAGADAHDTDDWICAARVELPLTTEVFDGAEADFRVPSWAPASSQDIARWSCRVLLARPEGDIDTHGEFAVRVGREQFADEEAMQDPVSVVAGDAATALDIRLPTPVVAAGDVIRGHLIVTPSDDLPDGELAVCWQKHRESHPLQRTPAPGGVIDGPIIAVDNRIPLRAGEVTELPFEIPLPVDAPPTATAVNSSMTWYVQAQLRYPGSSSHPTERVAKPIFVVNG